MTNFEKITESPEMLASVLAAVVREAQMRLIYKLDKQGISCSIISVSEDMQTQIHKEWLEREWQGGSAGDPT